MLIEFGRKDTAFLPNNSVFCQLFCNVFSRYLFFLLLWTNYFTLSFYLNYLTIIFVLGNILNLQLCSQHSVLSTI